MKPPAAKKRFPAWLRFLIWLGFILLALAMPLSLARWLMESSHQTAVKLVKQRGTLPKSSARNGKVASIAPNESAGSHDNPVAELPLVGVYIGDDAAAREELEKLLGEIRDLDALQYLLVARAEARLRTGDADGAWSDLQTMNSSVNRCGDVPGAYPSSNSDLFDQMMLTARTGVELGAWTDAQLTGISTMLGEKYALDSMRREMEFQKLKMADYFTHFRENQNEIQEEFSRSESPIDKLINRFGIATATDQQLADNLAVIHYKMDQPFTRFDPDTGFYLGESAGDIRDLPRSKPSDISFDKFYYMYSEMYGQQDYSDLPEEIIQRQTTIDQTRIAAALEMQYRATGEYPATLDAVSAAFSGKIPRDIATGQPYFYQRDADGGYRLWGTGIDRTSEGSSLGSDLMWTHRPVKK